MRFTAEISCFETAYDAENGKQRLLQRHFEADEASETVVVTVRGKLPRPASSSHFFFLLQIFL